MRRNFLTFAITIFVLVSVVLTGIVPRAEAASQRRGSVGDYVLIVDDEGQPRPIDRLEARVDEANRSVAISVQDSDSTPLWLYVRRAWLKSVVPEPAFANHRFTMRSHNGTQWFGVRISDPTGENIVGVHDFRPEVGGASYTFGSERSISLDTCSCDDWDAEHHFGILNADWTDKPAVPNLRYQVSLFTL